DVGSCPALSSARHSVRIGVRPFTVMLLAMAVLLPTISARMVATATDSLLYMPASMRGAASARQDVVPPPQALGPPQRRRRPRLTISDDSCIAERHQRDADQRHGLRPMRVDRLPSELRTMLARAAHVDFVAVAVHSRFGVSPDQH